MNQKLEQLIKAEREARREANAMWYAYLAEKNIVKAWKILRERDSLMQRVHRLVANVCIAGYWYCPPSYQSKKVKTQSYLYLNSYAYA